MAVLNNNSSPALVKKVSQIWDHMPRRRKRHNRIMLRLLILVNWYSALILCLSDVHAKDFDATVFKGENMDFNNGNVLAKGEDNVEAEAFNENGTYMRIQMKNSENKNDDDSERSSEIIDMMQQPQQSHTLRHQEHYKQQQHKQQQQKQNTYTHKLKPKEHNGHQQHEQKEIFENSSADNIDDVYDDEDVYNDDKDDDVDDINADNENNRHLRHHQIQEAITPSTPPHHRRHENHLAKQRLLAKQTDFKIPQHHLRHQHHHQQEFNYNKQPQQHHLNHEMMKQNLTKHSNLRTKPLHQRYFDRESIYSSPFASLTPTEGPHLRHSGPKKYWQPIAYNANTMSHEMKDIKRVSLPLNGNENENNNKTTNENLPLFSTDYDVNQNANDNDNDNDAADTDDDYSYEDDDKEELSSPSKYSSVVSSNAKINVKRYTNPLRSLYKPPLNKHHVESAYEIKTMEDRKMNSNDDNDYETENEDNIEDYHDKYNKTSLFSSPASNPSNISDESLNDNDEDKFSDEKWNKIQHEHYRKQLQHQRAMQALRHRRPINDNSLLHSHQYSAPLTASFNPTATYNNNAWTKRQTVYNDDEDNIYSRYYVPGTMTRKKEEELGSPTAILETRRQYALQQRQNKALASAHHRRIVTEGSCRLPQPRVERIRKDSWKIYTPHCTILHRCADDAGCCPSERQTCAPKRTKLVELYFFVISLNETQGSIEKLTFVNHTECHCVDRSKQRAPEYGNSRSKEFIAINQIPYLRRASILNCFCPNLFEKILQEDGYCRCDCSSGNMGCDWLKRGMEHFSMNDRKCIIEGRCKLPTCEYGQYIKKHGRCPRREERHLSSDVDW